MEANGALTKNKNSKLKKIKTKNKNKFEFTLIDLYLFHVKNFDKLN
jgi:hypothetical protein